MNNILAVCDRETEYAQRLMEYISKKSTHLFRTMAFSDEKCLWEYARDKKIELLLISEKMNTERLSELKIGRKIIIKEEASVSKYMEVYKYQSADKLVKEVMSFYDAENNYLNDMLNKRRDKYVIGIFSPVGGTRKTSFALTLGQLLSKNNAVLYINLEGFSGLSDMLGIKFESGLSDLLYYSKQKNINIGARLSEITISLQNLDILPPAEFPEDIKDIKPVFWSELFSDILNETKYDHLIIDIGAEVSDICSVISFCDRVFVPLRKDKLAEAKNKDFREYIKNANVPLEKLKEIILPFNTAYDLGRGYYENLIWSELGDYTRNLIKEEMKCGLQNRDF